MKRRIVSAAVVLALLAAGIVVAPVAFGPLQSVGTAESTAGPDQPHAGGIQVTGPQNGKDDPCDAANPCDLTAPYHPAPASKP
jgi:hypothetical protein